MPSIVYMTRGSRKYAYRSTSYWDNEKKAPRSRREYLGVVQPDGTIVKPRQGEKDAAKEAAASKKGAATDYEVLYRDAKAENEKLAKRVALLEGVLSELIDNELERIKTEEALDAKLRNIQKKVLKK